MNTSYAYDALSRLLAVTHQAGGATVDGAGYAYDNAGNRIGKGNFLDGSMEQYTYDPIYQLTQVTRNSAISETYSYDAVGNRLTSLTVPSLTYNSSNELLSTSRSSYTYDSNGNLTSKTNASGTTGYAWDYENRLTSVTLPGGGGTVTFKYDPFGRRIQKSGPAGTTNYLYDRENVVTDLDANAAVLARYAQGAGIDEPLASLTGAGTAFFEADGLGSITSLSGSSGLTDTYTYKPFGITTATGTNPNRFRFTGREFDQETNLYYYRARYYDPQVGRFISEDPLRFDGGENFYGYVGNHPLSLVDPSGLAPDCCRNLSVPEHPGYANIRDSIAQAESMAKLSYAPLLGQLLKYKWFYDQVKHNSPNDYKKNRPMTDFVFTFGGPSAPPLTVESPYEDFGNFNYGAMAGAAGIPLEIVLRAAGYAGVKAQPGTTTWDAVKASLSGGSHGDDPKDQEQIKAGYEYYRLGCYKQ